MCGFIGSVTFGADTTARLSAETAKRIRWRGPDAFGQIATSDHVLASARLAIIDLNSEADQPVASADGEWELVFNGEIYNYRELAAANGLGALAHRSDTWTTLELIARFGVGAAHRQLRGMYAFAAWEKGAKRLWLVRDPYGIKPLAWTTVGATVLFGSDPRTLAVWRTGLGASNRVDAYALTHYLMLGYVPGDSTIWEEIRRVGPGSTVKIDTTGDSVEEWDPFATAPLQLEVTPDDVARALEASVARHLIADVEIGSFLSGGIDSGLITNFAQRKLESTIKTYSVGFDSRNVPDETAAAERIARAIRTSHTALRVGASDFTRLAQSVAEAFPEPHADPAAMPMLALSERASQDVKVVLTGEGGDEIFGGYRRYWSLPLTRRGVGRIAGRLGLRFVAQGIGNRRLRQVADSTTGTSGAAFVRHLTQQHWDKVTPVSPLCTAEALEHSIERYQMNGGPVTATSMRHLELRRHLPETYLEKDDRTTMRYGLEARVPFLDLDLAAVALALEDRSLALFGKTKVMLRRVATGWLGPDIASAPKRGFTVPVKAWISGPETMKWIRETLLSGSAVSRGIFDAVALSSVIKTAGALGDEASAETLYRLLALELWARDSASEGAF